MVRTCEGTSIYLILKAINNKKYLLEEIFHERGVGGQNDLQFPPTNNIFLASKWLFMPFHKTMTSHCPFFGLSRHFLSFAFLP